jgi:glucokinase
MYRIGIDVGGTNLAAGVLNEDGRLLSRIMSPTDVSQSSEKLCEDMLRISLESVTAAGLSPAQISGIGIGVPGSVDRKNGIILYTPNAPFRNTPVRRIIQSIWNLPVVLENDANCAALGEYYAGNAKGCHSAVVVTLGTGIGVGVILQDNLFLGGNQNGLEGGHTVIMVDGHPCNCGRKGCWEQYASATALKRIARDAMIKDPGSMMWTLCENSLEQLNGRIPFQAAHIGDTTAREVIEKYLGYIAAGLTNLMNLFQPEILCLGGGVSNEANEDFLIPLQALVNAEQFGHNTQMPSRLEKAALGNDAGIIGAAYLVC